MSRVVIWSQPAWHPLLCPATEYSSAGHLLPKPHLTSWRAASVGLRILPGARLMSYLRLFPIQTLVQPWVVLIVKNRLRSLCNTCYVVTQRCIIVLLSMIQQLYMYQ